MHEKRFTGGVERLRSPERISNMEIDKVVEHSLEGVKIGRLLDIGTGSGLFAEAYAKRNIKVAGIDVLQEMIEAAKSFVPDGDFRIAVAEKLPFSDNSFDAVLFGVVLHETDDMLKALKEAQRVANKKVFVLEWQYKAGEYGPPLEHRIKPEVMNQLIKEAGFNHYDKIDMKELVLYRLTV